MNDTAVWLVIQAANMAEGGKRQPSSLCFYLPRKQFMFAVAAVPAMENLWITEPKYPT